MKYNFLYILVFCVFFVACQKQDKVSIDYESINLSTSVNLRGVCFLNLSDGYIGGGKKWETGFVWQTTDGGNTWQADTLEAQAVHKINRYQNNIILGTSTGRFFWQTEENNWQYTQTNIPNYGWKPLFDVAQTNDSTLLAISGEGYYWGAIAKSSDMGKNWSYFMSEHHFFDLEMINEQVGIALGFGAVFSTKNAGETWELLDLKGDIFKAASFVTPQTGYIVGDEGGIWKTSDGGNNFEVLRQPNNIWNKRIHWNEVQFLNENEGWLIGENEVWRTQNGGKDWEVLSNLPNCNYRAIHLFSYDKAMLVGDDACVIWVGK